MSRSVEVAAVLGGVALGSVGLAPFLHREGAVDAWFRLHWPRENRTWPWIVYGSATVPTIPFSLEDLDLSMDYDGQINPRYIEPRDERTKEILRELSKLHPEDPRQEIWSKV